VTTLPTEEPTSGPGGEVIPLHSGIDLDATAYFERGDQAEIADKMLTALGPAPLTHDAGEFWRYNGALGIWEHLSGHRVRTLAKSFAGCPIGVGKPRQRKDGSTVEPTSVKINASTCAGAEAIARDELLADPDRVTFDGAPLGVAFSNGFVTVRAGKIDLIGHDPAHRCRHAYPFPFMDAATPRLDRFLGELFGDVDGVERDLRTSLLQEFSGATLIGEACRYQRCLVLFGTGGNGKSELLDILRGLFPPEAVTSLAPQWWSHRFRSVMLEGKLANFCDELPDAEIMGGEAWKAVVTGEPIPGEKKNRDPFIFRPRTGSIFNCNAPIRSTDHSEGFWRRPLVVALSRKFENDPGRILSAGADVLEAERPAIAAWAIRGAARAQQQRGYTVPPSSLAIAREWRDENDQVRGYIGENPVTELIQAKDLYKRYAAWAKESGLGPMSLTMFGRRLMAAELVDREGVGRRFYLPRGMAKRSAEELAEDERMRAAVAAEEERQRCG
jgi:P4 family phage/plasmid primase-like protien